jgi:hypothetical protein
MAKLVDNFLSRKMWACIGTSVAILVAWVLTNYIPALAPSFQTLIGGLLAVLALMCGSNVAEKHVLGNNKAKMQALLQEIPENQQNE